MDGQNYLIRLHNLNDLDPEGIKFKYLEEMSLTGN